MTNRFRTWLNMFNTVIGFAKSSENQPVTALVPKFKNGVDDLAQKVADINVTMQAQIGDNLGYAQLKALIKKDCCTNLIVVNGPALSWCDDTNNPVLKGKINFTFSQLLQIQDADFADSIQKIYDLLFPNAAALISYGVSAGSFTALQTSISDFIATNNDPRQAIGDRKFATKLLSTQMHAANTFCKTQLDKIAKAYIKLNADYYDKYLIKRKQIPVGNTTTKYRGVIKDEVTGKPIVGAIVAIEGTSLYSTTDIKGKVVIDKVPFGIRKLKVGAEGYTSQLSDPIEFKKGKYVTLNFSLVPAFVLPATPVTVNS